jgi:Tfp pilus assembly protein PilF/peroxiredoxin
MVHQLFAIGEPAMNTDPLSCPFRWTRLAGNRISRRSFLRQSGLILALQAAGPRAFSLLATPGTTADPNEAGCESPRRTPYPPQLQAIIAKLDPSADDFSTEIYVEQLEKVISSWNEALCKSVSELKQIGTALAETLEASSFQPSEVTPLRTSGPLRTERRHFSAPRSCSRENFISSWSSFLRPLAKIELLESEIYGIRVVSESPLRVDTEIRYDIVGIAEDQSREERVGAWAISWVRDEQHRWQIQRWTLNSEIRASLAGPGFTDVTADCVAVDEPGMKQFLRGIDDWRSELDGSIGIDVYGNHGVAAGDIDGNGYDGFYVCQPSGLPNRLYRNRGDGTFEDITESSGTGILDGTASALFIDFQNRGRQDLLVIRTGGPLLCVNQGNGRFEPRPDAFQFSRAPEGTFTSAAVADYDCNGLLDVYLCVYSYYQGLNQYQFPAPYYDAQNGPPNYLFRNRGDGTFEDVTAASGLNQNNNRFSFAAAWCDYDNSGRPSLYVANDFGRKNLYRNNGNGTFTDVADALGVEDHGPGMSTCWLDYDNDGLQDVYVANMWLKEGQRITASDQFLPGAPPAVRSLYQKHNAGNSLYRNAGNGRFEDKAAQAGTAMGRWSWSCAPWDFDNDGYADLYVANGFVSGPNPYDLQSFFWRQVAQRSLEPAGSSGDYELAWNAVNELVRSDFSWSGHQRNVFFANNRDGTFAEVPGLLGLDLRDDSRAFALSDFDHDGRLEFVLKNRTGPQLRIFRNDLQGIGNSVTFRLSGRTSNRDAIGATLILEADGKRQTQFVSAGSGFASQHTKELCFGVGSATQIASVTVRWPTGISDRYENVPINHSVDVVEGQKEFKATPYLLRPSLKGKPHSEVPAPAVLSTLSTWLVTPLYGPPIKLPDLRGSIHDLSSLQGHGVLLTFFGPDCGESRHQIEQLQRASAEVKLAGLSIFAIASNPVADHAVIQSFAASAQIDIPVLLADERTAGAWNIQHRYLFDRRRDISFPTSFLIDEGGAVIRIYRGPVEPQTILDDWKCRPTTQEERFARAIPFPGPYYGNEMKRNYFTYGVAFVEYGYPDEAQAAFQRVVEADPNHVAGWFNLGTVYLNKKMYPEARKCLLEAVRLDPRDADAWNNLGMISGEEKNYDEALQEFRNATRANPNYMLAVQNMVRIYEFQHRPADAQKALEELIVLSPNNPELHQGLAMTLVAQNENARAREELETAVRLRPSSADIINNLGVVLLRLGDTEEALRQFEKCQTLSPDFNRPYVNAALIYQRSGEPEKAQQVLEGFLSRHPDNDEVRAALEKAKTK